MPYQNNEDDGYSDDEGTDDVRHLFLVDLILTAVGNTDIRWKVHSRYHLHYLPGEFLDVLVLVDLGNNRYGAQTVAVDNLSVLHLVLDGGNLTQRNALQSADNRYLLVEQVVDRRAVGMLRLDDTLRSVIAVPHLRHRQSGGISHGKGHLHGGISKSEA